MRTRQQIERVCPWLEDLKVGLINSEQLNLPLKGYWPTDLIQLAIAQHYHVPVDTVIELMPLPYLQFYPGEHGKAAVIWLSYEWYNASTVTDPGEDADIAITFETEAELRSARALRDRDDPDQKRADLDIWNYGRNIPAYPREED